MDFGVLGLDVGQPPRPPPPQLAADDAIWMKPSKIQRTTDDDDDEDEHQQQDVDFSSNRRSNSTQHHSMLSFSSGNHQSYCPPHPPPPTTGSSSLNVTMHRVGGPFTPSQWMELEHQALIYKYITANVAVPSNLLNPIKKSLYPFALSSSNSSSAPSFIPGSSGWGGFHLGYPGSANDPEPGRCRRTDGKKWRCSRDAFGDQKYCERHISKGRHRSRKPVEGTKVVSTNSDSNAAAASSAANVRAASNCISVTQQQQQQLKNMQQVAANRSSSPDAFPNRFTLTDSNANTNARFQVPRASASAVTPPKQNVESPYSDFGHVSFDSSLNPSQQKNTRGCYNTFLNFNGQDHTQDQHSLHQFMDNDWPKDGQSSRNVISWPEELKSDWTQLSMSIPMTSSDFSSSSPSPPHKKLALSPLRLSRETEKQPASWMPTPWGGPSMGGGPLGEALSGNVKNSRFVKTSNMATHEELGFSPTGVLQKATFGSLSNNSSSGSSPRGGDESKHELLPYL